MINSKVKTIELTANNGNSRLTIAPSLQGKILIASNQGVSGKSYGWFNASSFQDKELDSEKVGGLDRIWIGPLGSQFSFYYQQLKPLAEENWKVPNDLSNGVFKVVKQDNQMVSMSRNLSLTNFLGTEFKFKLIRKISIFETHQIEKELGVSIRENIKAVAYNSEHELINIHEKPIEKSTGLVSLWSAAMLEGKGVSTVVIPKNENLSTENAVYKYMGIKNSGRLKELDSLILFQVDGKLRSKIGVSNFAAKNSYGCYSPQKETLTIVKYQKDDKKDSLYFNTNVIFQEKPFSGEAIPIYSNGPMDYSVAKKASFYELESTSAMKPLAKGDTLRHFQKVYHFSSDFESLNNLSKKILGVDLEKVNF